MAYNAQNIANIKRDGQFENYIEMERKLIASLEGAELVETKTSEGKGKMQIAHIYGSWSAGEDFINANGGVFACDVTSSFKDLDKEWRNFQSLNAAAQYAQAALRNHLKAVAASILAGAKDRLHALEAA